MARSKKTRKQGPIGVPKSTDYDQKKQERTKKGKGKPSGSRNNIEDAHSRPKTSKAGRRDPRLGSKKPISLFPPKDKKVFSTPTQELKAIEDDKRLSQLLEKSENGEKLGYEQQQYLDEKLKRHAILCEMLGIVPEEEADDVDPFEKLDAISLSDFEDSDKA